MQEQLFESIIIYESLEFAHHSPVYPVVALVSRMQNQVEVLNH